MRGFMHLVKHREVLEALQAVPPSLPADFVPDVTAARAIVEAAVAEGRRWLDPLEVKRLLEAYQIEMVPTLAAADAEQAVAHAESLFAEGRKVVLKVLSRDITHKSDVGGVVLNLATPDEVRAATNDILARAKSQRPDAKLAGVLVQPMVLRSKATRADPRHRRRSHFRPRGGVRAGRHGGGDHQRQGAGAAAA